jgi:phosphatidylglycerophosphate synthase
MLTPNRVQTNLVAGAERKVLDWICIRLPPWVTPDRMTLLGVFGAFTVFSGYCMSRIDPGFLWLASLGSVLHWAGDSLDGSLARFRRIERPAYGYFLDISVDALCNLFIVAGLGFTLFVRLDIALFVLAGYFMLTIYAILNRNVTGVFQLTFAGGGPTELRLCMISINTLMFFLGNIGFSIGGIVLSIYDCVYLAGGILFVSLYLKAILTTIFTLRREAEGMLKAKSH